MYLYRVSMRASRRKAGGAHILRTRVARGGPLSGCASGARPGSEGALECAGRSGPIRRAASTSIPSAARNGAGRPPSCRRRTLLPHPPPAAQLRLRLPSARVEQPFLAAHAPELDSLTEASFQGPAADRTAVRTISLRSREPGVEVALQGATFRGPVGRP